MDLNLTKLVVICVICIATLEGIALLTGLDGQIFSLVVGTISGLVGYVLPSPIQRKE